MSLTNITDYAAPKDWSDDDYWDNLVYELKPEGSSPQEGLNVVVTMTTYWDCSDASSNIYYLTDVELERFLTIQYLYWNGIRVFPDGSIEAFGGFDGGEEVIYSGKFGGFDGQLENGNKQIYDAHRQMIEDAKKAEEAAKEAAKAARKAKKLAKEKAEFERLKAKFDKAGEE